VLEVRRGSSRRPAFDDRRRQGKYPWFSNSMGNIVVRAQMV
jgi:hypothetical protein